MEDEIFDKEFIELDKKMKFCIVCGKEINQNRRKFWGSNKCKKINEYRKKTKEIETNPFYICQFCGYKWQLDFQPRFVKGNKLLKELQCPVCKNNRIT